METSTSPTVNNETDRAIQIVAYYTLTASATGAVPVPASSAAIVVENGVMLAHIASVFGTPIDISDVVTSIGAMGVLNIIGRNVFIEGAKLLSWGTGSIWAAVGLSTLGASTAGIQTFIIGMIAIEICKNNGKAIDNAKAKKIINDAKKNYTSFVEEWSYKKPPKPQRV